jgi:hypothetical protein
MLYSKSINDITWNDVNSFCERMLSENSYLDYKREFPNNLETTISAMANTYGGIILIGVEEDRKENKPILPLQGITFERELETRVMDIILSNISPPVFPEIHVCPDGQGEHAIVVIRIPQSHQTPHAINKNTNVYVRTGNRNKSHDLEEIATLDRIDWLKEGRRKSEELRIFLVNQSEARIKRIYSDEKLKTGQAVKSEKSFRGDLRFPPGVLTLSICPLFPKEPFMAPPEINKLYSKVLPSSSIFQLHHNPAGVIVSDGSYNSKVSINGESFWHTEFNIFGLFYYKQSHIFNDGNIGVIRIDEILCRLDDFLDSAVKFYNEISYRGALEFIIKLENIRDDETVIYLGKLPPLSQVTDNISSAPLDNHVYYSDVVLVGALTEQKMTLIYNSAKKIAWAFGWDLTETILDSHYKI